MARLRSESHHSKMNGKCSMIDGRRGNRIEMNANELNETEQSEKVSARATEKHGRKAGAVRRE